MVAAGTATGGQTGIAAIVGRRKQPRSQQLQPVAAAANTATADKTNSFLMFGLLRTSDRGEDGGSEWLDCAACGQASTCKNADRSIRRTGGGLSNSTPPLVLCKRNVHIFEQSGCKYAACNARDETGKFEQVRRI